MDFPDPSEWHPSTISINYLAFLRVRCFVRGGGRENWSFFGSRQKSPRCSLGDGGYVPRSIPARFIHLLRPSAIRSALFTTIDRGLRTSSRHFAFEFLLVKNCHLAKLMSGFRFCVEFTIGIRSLIFLRDTF